MNLFQTRWFTWLLSATLLISPVVWPIKVHQQTSCGEWSIEYVTGSDQRITAELIHSTTNDNCNGLFNIENSTGVLGFGGYVLELASSDTNANTEWVSLLVNQKFLLPGLPLQYMAVPEVLNLDGAAILAGNSTFDSQLLDFNLFLLRTALGLAGLDTFIDAETMIYLGIEVMDITANAFALAARGDMVGFYREMQRIQPALWQRVEDLVINTWTEFLVDKLVSKIVQSPFAQAKILINAVSWAGKTIFDYYYYQGKPVEVTLHYTPAAIPPTPVPVHYGWVPWSSPTSNDLYDIEMVSADNIWAVGEAGTILHWDGADWLTVTSPTSQSLECVSMRPTSNGTEGWIGGDSATLLVWDNAAWRLQPIELGDNHVLTGCAANSSEVFFALPRGSKMGVLNELGFHSLELERYIWGNYAQPGEWINNIKLYGEYDGWAVGAYGLIKRYDGYLWIMQDSPLLNQESAFVSLEVVPGTEGNFVWFVGAGGLVMYQVDNVFSEPWSIAEGAFYEVSFSDSNNGWAVGTEGLLAYCDGSTWRVESSPVLVNLYSVVTISATDGWAVGADGVILRYTALP